MKGDFSRRTFDATRHFTGVQMQQGRVLLDADWNEQADLTRHRTEVETRDLVGGCGGPLHQAAFGVLPYAGLPDEVADAIDAHYPAARGASAGDVVLSAGRYYVHGILCENEAPVPFAWQPDLPPQDGPGKGAAILNPGFHLLYLDVWERHLTALDVRSLRETALGGPDTATRTRTVWQVRSVFLRSRENAGDTGPLCESSPAYEEATAQPTGALRARARPEEAAANPCVLPPGAGYHGLENQLYRVEIHQGGAALDLSGGGAAGVEVTGAEPDDRRVTVAGGAWAVGDAVELFLSAPDRDPMAGTVAFVEEVENGGGGATVLTLNATFTAVNVAADQPRLRPVETTWKWSRDNGTVVAAILSIKDREVTIEHPGGDDVLGFRPGDWVEITDDYHDLHGIPGELVQVERRSTSLRTIVLRTAPAVLAANPDGVDPTRTPKLRRWDGIGAVKRGATGEGYAALEDGVEVRFSAGTYRTGGYWMIPARTATGAEGGTIEWPHAPAGGGPLELAPRGIRHHYCRLAIVERTGDTVVPVRDCRCLFAPVTAINAIAYVSGAGQEAMPDLTDPTVKVPLGLPLVVGMANGHCREGERVRFTVVDGDGDLALTTGAFGGDDVVDVEVGGDGLARCWWQLDGTTQHQRVRARLLDGGLEVHAPVLFNASLSVAHEVAYDPRACGTLQGQKTVQDAIDRVVDLVRIHRAGGDGQEAMPGDTLGEPLRVLVTSTCGPVANRTGAVEFEVIGVGGTLTGGAQTFTADTDGDGFATVSWTLDDTTDYQQVEARLTDAAGPPAEQTAVRFGATLSVARNVSYDTGDCGPLQDSDTVQAALDRMAALVRMHPAGPVVQTLAHGSDPEPLRVLVASTCGPVAQQRVQFEVLSGGGTLSGGGGGSGSGATVTRTTSAQGVASVNLSAPAGTLVHEVEARFQDDAPDAVEPRRVRFVVVRGQAGDVAYTPDDACADMAEAGVETVSQALDFLCARPGGQPPHDYFDDLRADGVVLREDGMLGLEVRPTNAALRVAYAGGTAYVAGHRFQIDGGEVEVAAHASHQMVLVDEAGQVEVASGGALPEKYAALALVSTFQGVIRRIVDARLDLTHLDEKVVETDQDVATRRTDRRPFVPLLAQTLRNLEYRDGRNYFFPHAISPFALTTPALACDGSAIWAAGDSAVVRIPKDATGVDQRIEIPVDRFTLSAAFDGQYVWFSTFGGDVVHVDTHSRTVGRLQLPGVVNTMGLAFDGEHLWVADFGSPRVDLIDVATLQVVATFGLTGQPTGMAFDGSHMWIGIRQSEAQSLVRIRARGGEVETILQAAEVSPWQLAFDGSHLWITTCSQTTFFPSKNGLYGPILKLDVMTPQDITGIGTFPNSHGLVFDGSSMWFLDQQAPVNRVYKVDVDTNESRGSFTLPLPPGTGAYDGTHLWYTGATRRVDGGSTNGIHRRLVS